MSIPSRSLDVFVCIIPCQNALSIAGRVVTAEAVTQASMPCQLPGSRCWSVSPQMTGAGWLMTSEPAPRRTIAGRRYRRYLRGTIDDVLNCLLPSVGDVARQDRLRWIALADTN